MKIDELRVLEADELSDRMRTARRELYELRFKHAVGQLENASEIKKVRHNIARIMTVLRERDFGILATTSPLPAGVPAPEERGSLPAASGGEEEPQTEEAQAVEAQAEATPKPKRGRKAKIEETP
jgi:large subunit ribosomal protein L29